MNLNVSEKSRGIVAFAVNTDTTDYVSIARKSLQLASHVLGLPHTLILEEQLGTQHKNYRHDRDTEEFVQWKNFGRNLCYELSPYDETIVIDADYLVQDTSLLQLFDTAWDYLLMRGARSLNDEATPRLMGSYSLPFVWATVFVFRKTPRAQMFFDLVKRVQTNYHYYRELFNIETRSYRNDYAFAIADIILNGFTLKLPGIPGKLLNVMQPINSIELTDNKLIIKDSNSAYVIPKMNLHVMSKQYLQSDNFDKFIANATA
jgi:hypothetical protein